MQNQQNPEDEKLFWAENINFHFFTLVKYMYSNDCKLVLLWCVASSIWSTRRKSSLATPQLILLYLLIFLRIFHSHNWANISRIPSPALFIVSLHDSAGSPINVSCCCARKTWYDMLLGHCNDIQGLKTFEQWKWEEYTGRIRFCPTFFGFFIFSENYHLLSTIKSFFFE